MKRTAKLNDKTKRFYDEYDNLIKELDMNFSMYNLEAFQNELYMLQINTNKELEKWRGSMMDYFNKYTVDYRQIELIEEDHIYENNWTEENEKLPD